MILTVTPNTALDVTYELDRLRPGRTHRVRASHRCAGGKGVNVARTLHALGERVVATGFLGGDTGALVRADLLTAGIPAEMVPIATDTRRTVSIVDDNGATVLSEAGPEISAAEWEQLGRTVHRLATRSSTVVCSGSLPPGAPVDGYARLIRICRDLVVPCLIDTSGEPLRVALNEHPDLVKPNADELAELTGVPDPVAGAAAILAAGARAVVVSVGSEGLLAMDRKRAWRARPPEVLNGNPVGAGDAVVAALAVAAANGQALADALPAAVALSVATVATPVAGRFDQDTYRRTLPRVRVEELR